MNKEELIKEYQQKPIQIGDSVDFTITWKVNELVKIKGKKELQKQEVTKSYNSKDETVVSITEDCFVVEMRSVSQGFPSFIKNNYQNRTYEIPKEFCTINTDKIGYNPNFSKEIYITEHKQDLNSLYTKIYGFRDMRDNTNNLNWNPIFETEDGVAYYQREFCWELQDKQLLIERIYNQVNIGRFVFRKRSWEYIQKYKNDELRKASYYDIVDSKQRLNALKEFRENKFPDLQGYYFKDFSLTAKRNFLRYSNLTVAELPESTTDSDVKELFLKINFSGKIMSNEHLQFVKSINVK